MFLALLVVGTLVAYDRQCQLDESVHAARVAKAWWSQQHKAQDQKWLEDYRARLGQDTNEAYHPALPASDSQYGVFDTQTGTTNDFSSYFITNLVVTNDWVPTGNFNVWGDAVTNIFLSGYGGAWLRVVDGKWVLTQSNALERVEP